jgi:hypothetical protein
MDYDKEIEKLKKKLAKLREEKKKKDRIKDYPLGVMKNKEISFTARASSIRRRSTIGGKDGFFGGSHIHFYEGGISDSNLEIRASKSGGTILSLIVMKAWLEYDTLLFKVTITPIEEKEEK